MHIEMGDDGRYIMTDIGTIIFYRYLGSPLRVKDVIFILGLKKNLVSIEVLEDCGYDVIFIKENELLRHIATRKVKHIGV